MGKKSVLSSIPENTSVLRLVCEKNKDLLIDKKYKASYKVVDEVNNKTMAECDLFGNIAFVNLDIRDERNNVWQMRPNRKIMPSRWLLFDSNDQCAFEIRRLNLFRFFNPMEKTYFKIIDNNSNRQFKFEDRESTIVDRIFNSSPFQWFITEKGDVVATIQRLARKEEKAPKKGFLNKLKRFFRSSDWVLFTPGTIPVIHSSVYLALMLLKKEHTRNITE
jgi:hypothetical protein